MKKLDAVIAKNDVRRAISGLVGCAPGGWPETRQAMAQLRDELPRGVSTMAVIDRALCVVAGRYQWCE